MLRTFEKSTRAGNAVNPAKVLYRTWLAALEPNWPWVNLDDTIAWDRGEEFAMFYGPNHHYGIGVQQDDVDAKGRPIITFGPVSERYGKTHCGVGTDFKVNADGEFQIGHKHGWKQRDILTKMTFLRWVRAFSEYVWFYDASNAGGSYATNSFLSDPDDRIHYYPERLLRVRSWRGDQPWMKLVPDNTSSGWRMAFSRDADPVLLAKWGKYITNRPVINQEAFDQYDARRERRYMLALRRAQIADGVIPETARKPIDIAARNKTRHEQAQYLMAALEVSQPAKTTRLRKRPHTSEEEEHGNTVDPAHTA